MNDFEEQTTETAGDGFLSLEVETLQVNLAMVGHLGLRTLGNVIYAYPTQVEAIRQAADAYNRTRLTPLVKRLFTKWLEWRRA